MTEKDGEGGAVGTARALMQVLRFRFVVLVVFLGLTGALCLQMRHIRVPQDTTKPMIPPGHRFYPALQAMEAMDTTPETVTVILEVQKGDIYNQETVQKVERITRDLMGVGEIRPGGMISLSTGLNHYDNTVEGLVGEPILGRIPPVTKEDFEAVKRRVAVNPLGIGSYVAYDGTATLITAPIADLDTKASTAYGQLSEPDTAGLSLDEYKKRTVERFQDKLLALARDYKMKEEDANHKLYFIGVRTLTAEMTEMGRRQVPVAGTAMLILIVLLLAAYFRNFRGTVLPVFAFAFSALWALGFLGANGTELNPMAFLFPVMLGMVSLVCCALVLGEANRSGQEKGGKMEKIAAAYRSAPMATSVLAAGLVSMALLAAGVPMLRQLGLLGLFWALGTFVVVVLICPVLISLLPGPGRIEGGRRGGVYASLAEGLAKPFRSSGRVALWLVLGVILAVGVLLAWKLNVGDNTPGPSYLRSDDPWNQGFKVYAERFNGPYTFLVYAQAREKGGLLDPEAINEMGDFSTYLRSEGGARESYAFDWIVKLARMSLMDGNPKWWTVPASKQDVEGLSRLVTFPGGLEILVDKTFSQASITSLFPKDDAQRIDEYVQRMEAYIDSHPSEHLTFSLGGGLLGVTKAINDGTRDAYWTTLALSLIVVFVLGIFAAGSFRRSLIVTLTLAAAQAGVLLIAAAAGREISLAAVPALAVGLGFGAVVGIYLARKAVASSGAAAGSGDAARGDIGRAGGLVVFSGVLVFSAMLPWFFIGLKFQSDMAWMLGVTVLLESLAAVVFIPALAADP